MTGISPAEKTPTKRKADGSPGRRKRAEPGRGGASGSNGVPATRFRSARGGSNQSRRSQVPAPIRIAFGNKIRKLRVEKGISQQQLSINAGLYRTTISEIERGAGNIRLSTLRGIKRALRISIAEMMSGVA